MRVRHGIGAETGDIGRMKRQQAFIAAMVEKVVSKGTLANPVRLYKFLDAATQSLTTDTGFAHLKELASLGSSLKNIGLDNIQFLTVPNEPYAPDPNRLQLAAGGRRPVAQDPLRPAAGQARRRRRDARAASPARSPSDSASPAPRRLALARGRRRTPAERGGAQAGGRGGGPLRLSAGRRAASRWRADCCYRFVIGVWRA